MSSDDALALAGEITNTRDGVELDNALYQALMNSVGQELASNAVDAVWRVLIQQPGFDLGEVAHSIDYQLVRAYVLRGLEARGDA